MNRKTLGEQEKDIGIINYNVVDFKEIGTLNNFGTIITILIFLKKSFLELDYNVSFYDILNININEVEKILLKDFFSLIGLDEEYENGELSYLNFIETIRKIIKFKSNSGGFTLQDKEFYKFAKGAEILLNKLGLYLNTISRTMSEVTEQVDSKIII